MDSMSGRKHFRFPLVSDNEPIITKQEASRVLFEGEPDTLLSANVDTYVQKKNSVQKNKAPIKSDTAKTDVSRAQETLSLKNKSQHAQSLPERRNREVSSPKRPEVKRTESSLNRRSHRPIFQTTVLEEANVPKREMAKDSRKQSHHTPFRPKNLPESLVKESKASIWKSAELANQMKEQKKDYLLFDTVNPEFEEDKITNNEDRSIHQSSIKTNENHQVLTKKNPRLEKSLSGIMDEEQSQLRANKYFLS